MSEHKRRRESAKRQSTSGDTGSGEAPPGAPVDPASMPPETPHDHPPLKPRAAPAPRSPLSDEEMERLKSKAATSPPPSPVPGQVDPATRKERP